MNFKEKLQTAVRNSGSTLCVGLDPNTGLLPAAVNRLPGDNTAKTLAFCKTIIDATYEHCAAYKPNFAFFEALGARGHEILKEIIDYIPENRLVIADAKRGDISSTAEHYKKSVFDFFDADAVTLNPLMGFETLNAFAGEASKAVFVLALTSNPGAGDFLKQPFRGYSMMSEFIAARLAELSAETSTHLGMVIGATQPEDIKTVLAHYPEASLLIPGIGAQGGSIPELARALEAHKGIPLINASRSIIYAGSADKNWAGQAAAKALETKNALKPITERYV